jgi:hypothetical protein
MIQIHSLYTIPDEHTNPEDPRTHGNPSNAATGAAQRAQNGRTNSHFNVIGPQIYVFH